MKKSYEAPVLVTEPVVMGVFGGYGSSADFGTKSVVSMVVRYFRMVRLRRGR